MEAVCSIMFDTFFVSDFANSPYKPNPDYKGKWYAPMIDNPEYKGEWAPRKIANPDYFEDLSPVKSLVKIVSLCLLLVCGSFANMLASGWHWYRAMDDDREHSLRQHLRWSL